MPLLSAFFMLSTLRILCNFLNRNVAMAFITTILQIRKHRVKWVIIFHRRKCRPKGVITLPSILQQDGRTMVWIKLIWYEGSMIIYSMILLASWEYPRCLSKTHNCRSLLSFVHSWSPSLQGSAWYVVGAHEIFIIEGIVPSFRVFLLWVSLSTNAHEKVLNWIFCFKIHITGNR